MSATHSPRAFVKSVLQNGVGRYVCQLQRVTLKFCKSHAGSRGMRDFIEKDLLEFTREHPGVVVYLQPRRHRTAELRAEYLNGNVVNMNMHMRPSEEVCQWIEHLRCRSGLDIVRMVKRYHTDSPSTQGIWSPFTNKDTRLNITEFPSLEYSQYKATGLTATEKLLKMAEELRTAELQIDGGKSENLLDDSQHSEPNST